MTPWNPPYYEGLLAAAGLEKAKDLLGFWIPFGEGFRMPERYLRVLERVQARTPARLRRLDRSDFPREVERAWEVYNEAWERNWGFVPMTGDEFRHMASMLKLLLVDDFAWFVEVDGEPAGFAMGLMDFNVTLSRVPGGRLLFGLPMLLLDRPRLRTGRAMLLGVKARYRSRHLYLLLLEAMIRRAIELPAQGGEASWILEDNRQMLSFFDDAALPPTKRWRVYERETRRT